MNDLAKTSLQTLAVLFAFSALFQIVTAATQEAFMAFPAVLTGLIAWGLWRWSKAGQPVTTRTPAGRDAAPENISEDEPLDAPGWEADTPVFAPSMPRPIQARLKLTYRDSGGDLTDRTVDARECDTSDPAGYLIGHCHLRNAIRTFRLDRIQRAVDMETGEIIPDMTAYAARKYAESPIASLDGLLGEAADALRALFYVGKADGRFTAKEKRIFLEYCHATSGDARITQAHIDALCQQMDIPSQQAFKLICGRLAKQAEPFRQQVLLAAEAMVATEKTLSGNEAEALEYLRRRLSPAG